MDSQVHHNGVVVGNGRGDAFVGQGFHVRAVEDIVNAECGEWTVVGGAKATPLLNVRVFEQFGGLLVEVGGRCVVEVAGNHKGDACRLDQRQQLLLPFLLVLTAG